MISLQHLRTPMQTIRRVQADIIIRSRRSVKPSSELFQILPDFIEIYNDSVQGGPSQRQTRKLILGHMVQGLTLNKQFRGCPQSPLSKNFSTHARFEDVQCTHDRQSAESQEPGWESRDASKNCPGQFAGFLSLEQEILRRLESNEDSETLMQNNIKNLAHEIHLRKQYEKPVPERIHSLDLDHLLTLETKSSRNKCLSFLSRKENLKLKQAEEKLMKHNLKAFRNSPVQAGLTVRNCFIRHGISVSEATASQWNLVRGLMFGQPILFDLSYEGFMDRREVINTVLQLGLIVRINKTLQDPFHIHFTNIPEDGTIEKELKRVYGDHVRSLMVSISNKSPQHVLCNEDLVYLSADSPNILTEFDSTKVYIIGGFVDRRVKSNISLGRAEEKGIPHARLPLDEHLVWHKSTKNLTLDQMMCILSELKLSGNWNSALKHVPKRKHLGSRV